MTSELFGWTSIEDLATKGPLAIDPEGDNMLLNDDKGVLVAIAAFRDGPDGRRRSGDPEMHANLARISACWNACVGIPTEVLNNLDKTTISDLLIAADNAQMLLNHGKNAGEYLRSLLSKFDLTKEPVPETLHKIGDAVGGPLPPPADPNDGWAHSGTDDSVDGLIKELTGMMGNDRHEQLIDKFDEQLRLEVGQEVAATS